MSKKNPEKFQQKQIKDKEMKRKKEIRKRQEKLHTFISIMYYYITIQINVPTHMPYPCANPKLNFGI